MTGDQPKHRFKLSKPRRSTIESPEALFRTLRKSSDIPHLWSQQADTLRNYMEHAQEGDLALELPTGSGKTLVGLLIADFRRQSNGHRVAYLCPTRQLASQVASKANEYGIGASLCIPPNYTGLNAFQRGESIAVTTYSAIFNNNPRIDSPQTILLDDAHAGGGYIAQMWSARFIRENHESLVKGIASLIGSRYESIVLKRVAETDVPPHEQRAVELIPFVVFGSLVDAMRELIDAELSATDSQRFPWSNINEQLHACCMFVSYNEVLIRPVIPPTLSHRPFAAAQQRIYMSATLGYGGELERITGRTKITRLPIPGGWDRFNTGRRLFLFPPTSSEQEETNKFITVSISEAGRAVVLTPNRREARRFTDLLDETNVETFLAKDIEASLQPFIESELAALVLTNRYDGLDLPDDACRILIMAGHPIGVNALEQFLFSHLGVESILLDRMRTRFTQGVGRCCRNDADYSAVLVIGQELYDLCARADIRKALHPELQAEIEFGLEQADDTNIAGLAELLTLFLQQDESWSEAETHLQGIRDDYTRELGESIDQLTQLVKHEVRYSDAMWQGDFPLAAEEARSLSDGLTDVSLASYRAWWYYLSAWAMYFDKGGAAEVDDALKRACRAARAVPWYVRARRFSVDDIEADAEALDSDDLEQVERVYQFLVRLGFHGAKFDRTLVEMRDLLAQDEATPFERGMRELGVCLGLDASRPDGISDPDGVWPFGPKLCVALEAKSNEGPNGEISMSWVRQSSTHANWVRQNHKMDTDCEIVTSIITERDTLAKDARGHEDDLRHWRLSDVRALADETITVLRSIRASCSTSNVEAVREQILQEFGKHRLLSTILRNRLIENRLNEL